MTDELTVARIRDEALQVAHGWSAPDAPPTWRLTASVFECLANDNQLLELATAIPPERLPPLLFVASVQRVVARHPDDRFAAYFPLPGGAQPPLDDQFAARYRVFCLEHRDELADVQDHRVYQSSRAPARSEACRETLTSRALEVLHLASMAPGGAA